jgi:hypothetical protein
VRGLRLTQGRAADGRRVRETAPPLVVVVLYYYYDYYDYYDYYGYYSY